MASKGIELCKEAFERIKRGEARVEKFKGIPQEKVTPSVISQEAGFDSGYLKRARATHQPLISLIDAYRSAASSETLSKSEAVRREKVKTDKAKSLQSTAETLLQDALARELVLVRRLKELEKEVAALKKGSSNILDFR
ncbi:hypothetical protein QNE90_001009 [Vibrio alginolyticus]|nr:hypothetical protein [Vibrio alginolyticus]